MKKETPQQLRLGKKHQNFGEISDTMARASNPVGILANELSQFALNRIR